MTSADWPRGPWDWSADPGAALTAGCTPALDHQRNYGRDMVGVRRVRRPTGHGDRHQRLRRESASRLRHRHSAPTTIGVGRRFGPAPVRRPPRRHRHRLGGNARWRQCARGVQADGWGPIGAGGQRRPLHVRRTWLVLRMDPQRNVAAVAARDSLASTLVAATERLAHDLDGLTCAARPLTADELAEVDARGAGRSGTDLEPPRLAPPQALQRVRHQLLWLSPSDITTEKLEELWQAEDRRHGADHPAHRARRPAAGFGVGALPQRQAVARNGSSAASTVSPAASWPRCEPACRRPTARPPLVVPSRSLRARRDELALSVDQLRRELAEPTCGAMTRPQSTAEDARNAMVAGLLASGISVNGLQPSHNPQVASQMFTTATNLDPSDV